MSHVRSGQWFCGETHSGELWGAFPPLRRVEPSGRWVLRETGLSTTWTSAPAEGFSEHYSLLSSHPVHQMLTPRFRLSRPPAVHEPH